MRKILPGMGPGAAPHTLPSRGMRDDAVDHADGERTIDSGIDLPVLVDVVIAATPALCGRLVTCLVEDPRVDPADGATEDAVAVEHFVLVELHVVRIEADVDLLELARPRIEVLHLAEAAGLRRECGRRMRRAERRLILGQTEPRRHPHAPLAVHGGVIGDRRVVPIQLVAPVRRRHRHRLRLARRHFRIEHRNPELLRRVLQRIDDEEAVVAPVDAVDRTERIRGGIALIRRQLVVSERRRPTPVPHREHDVAFDVPAGAAARGRGHRLPRSDPSSARTCRARADAPSPVTMPVMPAPSCPVCTRRSHASTVEANVPSAFGISRVGWLPIW